MINILKIKKPTKLAIVIYFALIFLLSFAITNKVSAVCQFINNIVDLSEECDDANSRSNDGCSACNIEPGFDCTATVGQRSFCSLECGNNVIDAGETCDEGSLNGQMGHCNSQCNDNDSVLLTAGGDASCAVNIDNQMYCWGENQNYNLGDNTNVDKLTPTRVHGINNSGYFDNAISISTNNGEATTCAAPDNHRHSCAINNTGIAYCWGANYTGQLGDGTSINRQTPADAVRSITAVTKISTGHLHTCALAGNNAYCWGNNAYSQIGDNTTTNRNTPIFILTSPVTDISAGKTHSCAVKNGNVYCWGQNYSGEIGDGTTTQRRTPVRTIDASDPTGFLTNVKNVVAGNNTTCALKNNGTVWCWGAGDAGQLGIGSVTNSLTPVQVVDKSEYLTNISQITMGGYFFTDCSSNNEYRNHACALKTNGSLWCWGDNSYGALGFGSGAIRSTTPVQVQDTTGAGWLANVTEISSGWNHTCASTRVGFVYCWGNNSAGQIGNNTTGNPNTRPIQTRGIGNIGYFNLKVSCGNSIVETGEECDDGNAINNDKCTNSCRFTYCGDNVIQNPNGANIAEVCDDGNATDQGACNAGCAALTYCGDGTRQNNGAGVAEVCDDGNVTDQGACNANCTALTYCGDGTTQNTGTGNGFNVIEACDDGNITNDGICNASCTALTYCGDGTIQNTGNGAGLAEECDPPNTGQCNASCLNKICGNNYVDTDEDCDDWDTTNPTNDDTVACDWAGGSGANACTNNTCGDYYLNDNEVCDVSFTSNPFRGATCASVTGLLDQGSLSCNANCLGVDTSGCYDCGNGTIEGPEQCDDYNTNDGYGCSSSCVIESGWSCEGTPSVCTELCGNGTIDNVGAYTEVCDDGNRNHETARDCLYGNPVCNFCNSNCSATLNFTGSYCGDGDIDYGAALVCAGGANANNTCYDSTNCPDSTCVQIEVCDLGAARNNDPDCDYSSTVPASDTCSLCLNNCKETGTANVPYCGDSIYDPSREDCDYAGAGCNACEIQPGFECGNFGPGNSNICLFHCGADADDDGDPLDIDYDFNGDGNIDINEQCDNGLSNNGNPCSAAYGTNCSWCTNSCEPRTVVGDYCGDGEYDAANEACDDGNTVSSDGCSNTCEIESGWQCTTTGSSRCEVVSGDGICVPSRENCRNNINDCGLCSIGSILTAFPSKTTGVLNGLLQSITNVFPAPQLRINIPGLNLNKARINQDIEVEIAVPDGVKTPFFVGDEKHSLNIIPNAADPTKIDISFE